MSISVELPCGLPDGNGSVGKTAIIKPMTGRTRQEIGDVQLAKSPEKFVTTILKSCVDTIAGKPATEDLLNGMVKADRNFLLLEIRKVTSGNVLDTIGRCAACEEKMSMKFDLQEMSDEIKSGDSIRPQDDYFVVNIKDTEFGIDAEVRIPSAKDSAKLEKVYTKNPIEGLYRMFGQCCIKYKSSAYPAAVPNYNFFLDMNIKEYDVLQSAFVKASPDVGNVFSADCPNCGSQNTIAINPADFFFPGLRSMA